MEGLGTETRVPWDNSLYEQDHFLDILAQDMFEQVPL